MLVIAMIVMMVMNLLVMITEMMEKMEITVLTVRKVLMILMERMVQSVRIVWMVLRVKILLMAHIVAMPQNFSERYLTILLKKDQVAMIRRREQLTKKIEWHRSF